MLMLASRTDIFRDILSEAFTEGPDGYWYPKEAPRGRALARVQFAPSGYSVERRRGVATPWYPVVTASMDEFDPTSFRMWQSQWPLVAPAS